MTQVVWTAGMTLDDIERLVIEAALKFYRQKTQTASALGISVRTLDNKLSAYQAADAAQAKALAERQAAEAAALAKRRGSIGVPLGSPAETAAMATDAPPAVLADAPPSDMPAIPPSAAAAPPPLEDDDIFGSAPTPSAGKKARQEVDALLSRPRTRG